MKKRTVDIVDTFWARKYAQWVIVIFANVILIPAYVYFSAKSTTFLDALQLYIGHKAGYWVSIDKQSYHLLSGIGCEGEVGCHEAKMTFRLLLPTLYKLLGRNAVLFFIVQYLLGVLASKYILSILADKLKDPIAATTIYVAMLFTYMGSAHIFDIVTCADGIGYALLIFSIYTRKYSLRFLFLFLSYWVDERALICSCFIALYWVMKEDKHIFDINFKKWHLYKMPVFMLLFSWGGYFAIRTFLHFAFQMSTPTDSADMAFLYSKGTFVNVMRMIRSMEAFWGVMIFAFIIIWKQRSFLLFYGLMIYWLLIMLVSLCVADTSRSIGYAIVGILIGVLLCGDNIKRDLWTLRLASFMILFVNILIPTRYLF